MKITVSGLELHLDGVGARGRHSDKVIAYELGLSASTVRVSLHRASKKLGTSTRSEAVARFDALTKKRRDGQMP